VSEVQSNQSWPSSVPEKAHLRRIAALEADLAAARAEVAEMRVKADLADEFLTEIERNLPDYAPADSPAEVICDLITERDEARAERDAFRTRLTAVMVPDFKDWHDNERSEWPDIAAWVITNLRERLADAEAERDAAQADAERYRWLRSQDPNRDRAQPDESQSAWVHVKGVRVDCMAGVMYCTSDYSTGAGLDAAIDAARKEGA
jgi:hypothetical protein